LRHREPPSGGVAVSRMAGVKAAREILRFAQNDINHVYVTASRRQAAWRSPRMAGVKAAREILRFAQNDINHVCVTASRRQAAWRCSPGPLRQLGQVREIISG